MNQLSDVISLILGGVSAIVMTYVIDIFYVGRGLQTVAIPDAHLVTPPLPSAAKESGRQPATARDATSDSPDPRIAADVLSRR